MFLHVIPANSSFYHYGSFCFGNRYNQGSHRSQMFLNVLEFDFVTQVPLNVFAFMAVFFNVLKNLFFCVAM